MTMKVFNIEHSLKAFTAKLKPLHRSVVTYSFEALLLGLKAW